MAMKMLRSKLYDLEMQKRRDETDRLDESKLEISFGSQIRSYIMQPYRLIKDHRTKVQRRRRGPRPRWRHRTLHPFLPDGQEDQGQARSPARRRRGRRLMA